MKRRRGIAIAAGGCGCLAIGVAAIAGLLSWGRAVEDRELRERPIFDVAALTDGSVIVSERLGESGAKQLRLVRDGRTAWTRRLPASFDAWPGGGRHVEDDEHVAIGWAARNGVHYAVVRRRDGRLRGTLRTDHFSNVALLDDQLVVLNRPGRRPLRFAFYSLANLAAAPRIETVNCRMANWFRVRGALLVEPDPMTEHCAGVVFSARGVEVANIGLRRTAPWVIATWNDRLLVRTAAGLGSWHLGVPRDDRTLAALPDSIDDELTPLGVHDGLLYFAAYVRDPSVLASPNARHVTLVGIDPTSGSIVRRGTIEPLRLSQTWELPTVARFSAFVVFAGSTRDDLRERIVMLDLANAREAWRSAPYTAGSRTIEVAPTTHGSLVIVERDTQVQITRFSPDSGVLDRRVEVRGGATGVGVEGWNDSVVALTLYLHDRHWWLLVSTRTLDVVATNLPASDRARLLVESEVGFVSLPSRPPADAGSAPPAR